MQFDHAAISREQHPLLTDELLQIKHVAAREESAGMEVNSSDDDADEQVLPDAFGLLSMNDSGTSTRFVGSSGSEVNIVFILPFLWVPDRSKFQANIFHGASSFLPWFRAVS